MSIYLYPGPGYASQCAAVDEDDGKNERTNEETSERTKEGTNGGMGKRDRNEVSILNWAWILCTSCVCLRFYGHTLQIIWTHNYSHEYENLCIYRLGRSLQRSLRLRWTRGQRQLIAPHHPPVHLSICSIPFSSFNNDKTFQRGIFF